jgi:TRAP-type mannitol/chloroaromatic compound transport system permease small subunit
MSINQNKRRVYQLIERANYILSVFSGIILVLLSLSTTYGVIRRYLFNSPEPYSYEFGCIFLIAGFVLVMSAVEWQNRFIRVDILLNRLPKNAQAIISNIISPFIGLLLVIILIWQGGVDALHALQVGQTSLSVWREPLYPVKFVITIGYGLLGLTLIARLWYGLISFKTKAE